MFIRWFPVKWPNVQGFRDCMASLELEGCRFLYIQNFGADQPAHVYFQFAETCHYEWAAFKCWDWYASLD